jgi:hypothetical protein
MHQVRRAHLFPGNALMLDWDKFDGIYFFNPFWGGMPEQISIRRAEMKLEETLPGTRVVTYHGFGGDMPADYRRLAREPAGTDHLELWQRS